MLRYQIILLPILAKSLHVYDFQVANILRPTAAFWINVWLHEYSIFYFILLSFE